MIIPVENKEYSYDIVIKSGAIKKASEYLDLNRKVLVVTDSGVPEEYAKEICESSKSPVLLTIPMGESSKNIHQLEKILSVMLENNFKRNDCIVAVGGGVVGDISGFAASCYMRGIDFYNLPTTLLSQVDSSIGGKTAIDFDGVKNSVGAFYQPKKVIIDPEVLKTLDKRQLNAGFAEVIKMSVTSDPVLFEMLESSEKIDISKIIEKALLIKKYVVENDPKENNLRRVLNFGHTIGHAVEASENGKLLHGECVAIGMLPFCGEKIKKRIELLLKKYSLPTEIPDRDKLLPYIIHDKKNTDKGIIVVFSEEIGTFEFKNMTADEIIGLI